MMPRALFLGASFAVIGSVAAQAADLIIPTTPQPIIESAGFEWDGFYAGAQLGGQFYPGLSYFLGGVHAGVNFTVADPIVVGLEGTAEVITGSLGTFGEFYINGRIGAAVTDSVLIYALAGTGVEVTNGGGTLGVFQLGGGVELAVTDNVSVRGQLTGVGFYNDGNNSFLDGTRATVGVSYHF